MDAPKLVPLSDLEPSIRSEIENGSFRTGHTGWAVIEDGNLNLTESLPRLTARIDGLKDRMEKMNERYREEMRYGDYNDPGFPERNLFVTVRYLERIAEVLAAADPDESAAPAPG